MHDLSIITTTGSSALGVEGKLGVDNVEAFEDVVSHALAKLPHGCIRQNLVIGFTLDDANVYKVIEDLDLEFIFDNSIADDVTEDPGLELIPDDAQVGKVVEDPGLEGLVAQPLEELAHNVIVATVMYCLLQLECMCEGRSTLLVSVVPFWISDLRP